jgi:hypothetical protein
MSSSPLQFIRAQTQTHSALARPLTPLPQAQVRPIAAAPGQQRPGNARHLIGDRHRHDPERSAFEKSCDPRILLRLVARPLQHRMPRPPECVSDIGRLVSRSARASVCRQSNLAAVRSRSRLQSRDPIEKSSTATGATTNAYRATTSPRTCAAWSRTGTPRAKRWRQRRPRRAADSRAADRTPEKHSR